MVKVLFQTLLYALPGAALSVGVKTIFAPCAHADGSVSACAACGEQVFCAGIAWMLFMLARPLLQKHKRTAMDAAMLLVGVCTFLLPILLRTCMMQSMRCNAMMKPAVWLISLVEIVLMATLLIRDIRGIKEKKPV